MIEFTDMHNDRHAIHYSDLPMYVIYHDKEIFIHESGPAMKYQPSDYVFYIRSDSVPTEPQKDYFAGFNFPKTEEWICLDSDMKEDLESKKQPSINFLLIYIVMLYEH